MKRIIFPGTFCILVLILVVTLLAFLSVDNVARNYLAKVNIEPGQEAFGGHYRLGLLYEQNGDWTQAKTHYEKAAVAAQPEIAEAAHQSLQAVLQKETDWRLAWQKYIRSLFRMPAVLVTVPLIALIVWLIWGGVTKIEQQSGYLLLPIEDHTKDDLGKDAHLKVNWILQEAQFIHHQADAALLTKLDEGAFPPFGTLSPNSEVTSEAFGIVDSLKIGGVGVNLAPIFNILSRWSGEREYSITGQLYQQENQLRLRAEIKPTYGGDTGQIWYLSGETGRSETKQAIDIVEQLAFRFLVLKSEGKLETNSWKSLRAFTRGLRARQNYSAGLEVKCLQEAKVWFQEAVQIDPDYLSARYALGGIYNSIGSYKEAEQEFEYVRRNGDRLQLEATYNLGISIYHQFKGDWTREKAAEHFETVINEIDRRTGDERAQLLLALAHCGKAMVSALEVGLAEAKWKIEPPTQDKPAAGRMELVQRHTRIAGDLTRYLSEEAQNMVQGAAHHALGEAYSRQQQLEKAREALEKAIELRPGYPVVYVSMANTYYPKTSDERIFWLQQAIKAHPGFEFGHYELGKIYDKRNEREAARAAFKNAPSFSDARNKLGEYLIKDSDYEGAMKEFEAATKLNSKNERAWDNMAWRTLQAMEEGSIQRTAANLQNVFSWSRKRLQLAKDTKYEWKARDILGWALLEQGQLEMAEQELLKSTRIEEGEKQLQNRYHLARVYRAKGDPDQAIQELKTGLGFGGSRTIQEKAKTLLQKLEYQAH